MISNRILQYGERLMSKSSFSSVSRLRGFDAPAVWVEFSPLSQAVGSINLGQGFPDWMPPSFVREEIISVSNDNDYKNHQYTFPQGFPPLISSLVNFYNPYFGNLKPNNIMVSVGAAEGLYLAIQALIEPGDEVILIEPAYDCYPAIVQMAGGVVKRVPLRLSSSSSSSNSPQDTSSFTLDPSELSSVCTSRTKALILNTPHNPTGKVFSRNELIEISKVLAKFPQIKVISDEVYEFMTYDDVPHVRIATLNDDMNRRTVTISSSSKMFSATGFKVGWAIGPSNLISLMTLAQQWITYNTSTTLQAILARSLSRVNDAYLGHSNYLAWLKAEYTRKRNIFMSSASNLDVIKPEGTFFCMANTSRISFPDMVPPEQDELMRKGSNVLQDLETRGLRDYNFARWLTMKAKVTPIPPSAFYSKETKHLAANLARFAFCKSDSVLIEAGNRLRGL